MFIFKLVVLLFFSFIERVVNELYFLILIKFLIHGLKGGYVQRFDKPATPVNNDYARPKHRRGAKY